MWIVDGLISFESVSGAETIVESGWITPGLVDAHCHVGIRYGGGGGETVDGLLGGQAKTERDAGVLLLRDAGSPVDTRFIDERSICRGSFAQVSTSQHRSGTSRACRSTWTTNLSCRPRWCGRHAPVTVGSSSSGDWIDRSIGDLAPLWSDEILVEAIAAAHAEGARVTAHVFAEDALPG